MTVEDLHTEIVIDEHESLSLIDLEPFQLEYRRQHEKFGLSLRMMAVRIDWFTKGEPDVCRMGRVLGVHHQEGRVKKKVTYDNAVNIAKALGKEPHEFRL